MIHKISLSLLVCLLLCSCSSPSISEVAEAKPRPKKATDISSLVGWWKGDSYCLDIDANGDIELSNTGERKKIVVGSAVFAPSTNTLTISVDKIWEARWVSRCREHTGGGDWLDSLDVLGLTVQPKASTTFTLKRTSDSELELCGEKGSCETLTKNTPRLGFGWQVSDWDKRPAQRPFTPEDIVRIDLEGSTSTLSIATSKTELSSLYGESNQTYVSGDTFTLVFTPQEGSDAMKVLGASSKAGAPLTFTAKRLKGHKLEVCLSERCSTLERYFSPDSYNP